MNKRIPEPNSVAQRQLSLVATALVLCVLQAVSVPAAAAEASPGRLPSKRIPASGAVSRKSLWQRLFGTVTWEDALNVTSTARDICRLVGRRLSYESDRGELWDSPKRTWERGKGDCEDYAITILEMCRAKNIPAFIRLYFPASRAIGHAIVMGKKLDGGLWMSSLGSYREIRSQQEATETVAAELGCRPSEMWIVDLSYEDVMERIRRRSGTEFGEVAAQE